MSGGVSKNCSFSNPCPICGKPDWCNQVTFGNGDYLWYCHRVHGAKGDIITASGKMWVWKKITPEHFTAWEPKEQYDANRESFIKALPKNSQKGTYYNSSSYRNGRSNERVVAADYTDWNTLPLEGTSECADPKTLNMFYRELLNNLVLENKHEAKLRAEWDCQNGMFEKAIKAFHIKSMPPEDRIRYSSKERLKNLSRKKIVANIIEKLGEPVGVPGFYQRKDGAWTLYYLSGIVFPVFDSDGNIIRIRIGNDYPKVKGTLNGKDGIFNYYMKDEIPGWYFMPEGESEPILAYQYGSEHNLISLNKKGYPDGKVVGKYMNFTSFKELHLKDEQGNPRRINKFTNGCESGSFCSLYTKQGDDPTIVYVTEGEKKAIVGNLMLNVPVVSVPGTSSILKLFEDEQGMERSLVDSLIRRGTRAFVIVLDADKKVNEAVLYAESLVVTAFKEKNLTVFTGEWNSQWGKGLDDILLTGVLPDIRPAM
ncbi:DUF3854 domain-containing protein [Butyrivibrio proteoclasticus]|uniref:DUF3854 domain-containing protein n=1 Tax=Butyrivibrio proteoclasticus TaxID=43305 RepID=UPI00047D4862|nr:DUF3854 domain-containing protein [Butyrivibrio proteoclasticus]